MKVKCAVRGQRLIRMDRDKIQKGSRGVNALTFTFDDEWVGLPVRVAGFKVDGSDWDYYPIRDDELLIPDDYCDQSFLVCLVGQDMSGRRQTTNSVGVEVK